MEISMDALWISLLSFWLGAMIGFGLFAALQVSREEDERQESRGNGYRFPTGC
jgi:hypothetical protein